MSNTIEHKTYRSAKDRCTNPNSTRYKYYGAKGITFEFKDFGEWYKELGPKPDSTHSVGRLDESKGYKPGNICWQTMEEQMFIRKYKPFQD